MIGIDIGTKFIKACQVDLRGGAAHDIYSVVQELPQKKGTVSQSSKQAALKNILSKSSFNTKRAVISAGCPGTVLRITEFPLMPEEELRNSIKYNAEKYIYTDLAGKDMDLSIIKREKDKLQVLVAASPRDITDEKVNLVQNAGYYAEIADIDILAFVNCFLKLNPALVLEKKSIALVESGHDSTGIAILNGDELYFAKNIKFGGADITKQISEELDISTEEAEKVKRNKNMWNEAGLSMKKVLKKSLPDLIENLHRAIEHCRNNSLLDSLETVYVSGGCSMTEGLCSVISGVMGIETVLWSPLDSVKPNIDKSNGPMLAVAAGLALREDND